MENINGIPLYVRTREQIRAEIAQMQHGDALAIEADLEQRFAVSRITVRRALDDLVNEGLITRKQGRGTFVQKNKLTHELNLITSWTEQIKRLGFTPNTVRRKLRKIKPKPPIAAALGLNLGDEVIRVERVRLADREPISWMKNYYPARLLPGLLERDDVGESFYELLEKVYGLVPEVAVDTVETHGATEQEARALKMNPGEPVLCVQRVTYLKGGTPLELVNVTSRGDRFQYQITVHGRPRLESDALVSRLLAQNSSQPHSS